MKSLNNSPILHPLIGTIIFLILIYATSCTIYYRVVKPNPAKFADQLDKTSYDEKVIFLHQGERNFQLSFLSVKGNILNADIIPDSLSVPPVNKDYRLSKSKALKSKNDQILREVHIYADTLVQIPGSGHFTLETSQILSIDIIKRNHAKEIIGYSAAAGLVIATVVVIADVAGLDRAPSSTVGSCPYAYSFNGEEFIFESEIYTGALFQNFEREDYVPLPSIRASQDQYTIRLKNKPLEREYSNLAELIVVTHPEGTVVLFDDAGAAHTISSAIVPDQAICSSGKKLLPHVQKKDNYYYSFDDIHSEDQELFLSFPKPANTRSAKLLLSAKNTIWGDQVIHSFITKFGNSYEKWQTMMEQLPSEERMQDLLNWEFPISVFIKIENEWRFSGNVFPVGPLGERNIILPLNLEDHHEGQIEMKLSSGFQFWEINQVSLDFSENQTLHIKHLKPIVTDTTNQNFIRSLMYDDQEYFVMDYGDMIDLHFEQVDAHTNTQQSVFLHAKGYYEYIFQSSEEPDTEAILKFKEPGYFSDFSKKLYMENLNRITDQNVIPH